MNKGKMLQIRLNGAEMEAVQELAAAAGMRVSAYCRDRILREGVPVVKPSAGESAVKEKVESVKSAVPRLAGQLCERCARVGVAACGPCREMEAKRAASSGETFSHLL